MTNWYAKESIHANLRPKTIQILLIFHTIISWDSSMRLLPNHLTSIKIMIMNTLWDQLHMSNKNLHLNYKRSFITGTKSLETMNGIHRSANLKSTCPPSKTCIISNSCLMNKNNKAFILSSNNSMKWDPQCFTTSCFCPKLSFKGHSRQDCQCFRIIKSSSITKLIAVTFMINTPNKISKFNSQCNSIKKILMSRNVQLPILRIKMKRRTVYAWFT